MTHLYLTASLLLFAVVLVLPEVLAAWRAGR